MHLLASIASVCLLASFGTLPPVAPATGRPALEVVFAADVSFCGGCKPSYVDSFADPNNPSGNYVCDNGDIWFFTEFTPLLRAADCTLIPVGCVPSGACEVTRVGYMTLIDNGEGECALYALRQGESSAHAVADDETFVMSIAVACTSGQTTVKDCASDEIQFFEGPAGPGAVPVMTWHFEACCNRCPG